jgi:ribosomal protein S18 acetylase RimI-like enzyme
MTSSSDRPTIRPFDPDLDLAWAVALLDTELGGRMQARGGELVDVLEGSGLVALVDGERAGLVSWLVDPAGDRAEIRALAIAAAAQGRGVGRSLLDATVRWLREHDVLNAWLVTTNDNLAALGIYQSVGFRLVALRPGAVDEARRTIKPSIPAGGDHGIPLRDELELAKEL